MRLIRSGKLFLVNKFLWAENAGKASAPEKFGSTYRYHLSLVTKNIIKVHKTMVGDFIRFLQIYLCLLWIYFS